MKRIAIYPGSFDPITNGHLDILKRASKAFDEIIVLIADNSNKHCRFSVSERLEMIKGAVSKMDNVKVDSTKGLTVKYAKEHGAKFLIRGLRAVSDFEYEFTLNAANEYIDHDIDTVYFMSTTGHNFISSSYIDSLYSSGVDISSLVPESVVKMYQQKK